MGAQPVLYQASDQYDSHYFRIQSFLSRMPGNQAACAVANHSARIAWALIRHDEDHSSLWQPSIRRPQARRAIRDTH